MTKTREPARAGGGLRLDQPPSVSEKQEVDITKKWLETSEAVDKKMNKWGFGMPAKPEHSPEAVTAQMLVGSTPAQYADVYTLYLSWYTYATPIKAHVETELLGYDNAIEELGATIRSGFKAMRDGKDSSFKMTDKEIKERVEEDVGVREMKYRRQTWQQMLIRIDAQLKIISKNMEVISRVQNERRQEMSGEKRDNNMRYEQHGRFKGR